MHWGSTRRDWFSQLSQPKNHSILTAPNHPPTKLCEIKNKATGCNPSQDQLLQGCHVAAAAFYSTLLSQGHKEWERPSKIAINEEDESHFVEPSKFFHQPPCPSCISGTSMQAIEALLNKLESAGVSNPYSTPIASIQASMQQPALHIHAG